MRRELISSPVQLRRAGLALVAMLAFALTLLTMLGRSPAATAFSKGVVTQAQLSAADAKQMRAAGVETLRFPLYWSAAEPRPRRYDWTHSDRMVLRASQAGAEAIPTLFGSPRWVDEQIRKPPLESSRHRRAWKRFVRQAVRRYGINGELPRSDAAIDPVRRWQVWNEPNIYGFWRPAPSPRRYADLLSITAPVVRSVNRRAQMISGGLAPATAGIQPTRFLRKLLKHPGARRNLDVIAVHPYADRPGGAVRMVGSVRKQLRRSGLRRMPLMITEVGWASSPADEMLQPNRIAEIYKRTAARARLWNIEGVLWYAWQDVPASGGACEFCALSGLIDVDGMPKPGFEVFAGLGGLPTRTTGP